MHLGTGTKWCCVHTLSNRYVKSCLHSYSILPCQTPFWNWHEISNECKAVDCRRTNENNVHTGTQCPLFPRRARTCPNSRVGTWLKKKGVFTLVPIEYRTQVPCPNTKCERCLTCSGLLLQKVLYHSQNFHSIWYFFYIKEGHEKEFSWVKHEKFTRSRFRLTAVLFVISRHCSLFLST